MDENTLQIDIYYRLVSLLAEDYLFEGVNCCLFEMFKKIKKRTYLVVCLFIVRLQNNVGFSKRVERLCSKGSFQHLVIDIGGRQDKFPWSKLTLLQFTTFIHKQILASILEVCLRNSAFGRITDGWRIYLFSCTCVLLLLLELRVNCLL